jgi:hypothetical protein
MAAGVRDLTDGIAANDAQELRLFESAQGFTVELKF